MPSQEYTSASSAEIKDEATKKDVVEAQPGLIESTELAPLGDEKVVAGEGNVAAGQGELYNHPMGPRDWEQYFSESWAEF